MKKIMFKGIAALLTLSMVLWSIPESLQSVFSAGVQIVKAKAEANREQIIPEDNSLKESAVHADVREKSYVLSENLQKREINKKSFNMSDGTILVEQYPVAVHYLDSMTGKYEEIDNSLVETTKNGRSYYRNAANDFKVMMQETSQTGEGLVQIAKGDYRLGFEPVSEKTAALPELETQPFKKRISSDIDKAPKSKELKAKVKASKVKGKCKAERQAFSYKDKKVETPQYSVSQASGITYENIWTGTDLEYEIHASRLKENIIVKEKAQDYQYVFKLHSEGLELVSDKNGSISAVDAEKNEIFNIPAPFMTDAAGAYSEAVTYSLENTGEYWYLTLLADSEWINDAKRAWPVVIDPIIEEAKNGGVITSATVYERNKATELNGAQAYAGKNRENACGLSNAYLLMDYIGLSNDYILTAGALKYTFQAKGDFPGIIFAYKIAYEIYSIDPDVYLDTLTYNNLPERRQFLYATNETFTHDKVFTRTCNFDISYIKKGQVAFGFYGPNTSDKTYIGVYTNGENAPVLQLRYRLSLGLGDNSVTETFEDVGITNYVNVFSKQLTSGIDCMEVNSQIMSLNVQAIYNASYDAYREYAFANGNFSAFTNSFYGKNFKLNIEQYCVPYDFDGDGSKEGYLYIDAGGGYHHFAYSDTENKYLCEDCALGYRRVSLDSGWVGSREQESLYFEKGRLTCIQNSEYQTMRINFDSSGRIIKVYNCVANGTETAPASSEKQCINFYYTNNLLSSMESNYKERVDFTYDSGKLVKIIRFSHPLATLSYDRSDMLARIIGRENSGYSFGYAPFGSSSESSWKTQSVHRIENGSNPANTAGYAVFSGNGLWCNVKTFPQGAESRTEFYTFDERGQCTSEYRQYDGKQDETEPRSYITVRSKTRTGTVRVDTQLSYEEDFSMIENGAFERITGKNPAGWTVNTDNTGNNYSAHNSGNALVLFGGSSAQHAYDFRNRIDGDYVLGFYADGSGNDCKIKVTLNPGAGYSSVVKKETLHSVGGGEGYYAEILLPRGTAAHYGTIMLENVTPSGSKVIIDNVTLSPLSAWTKTETNTTDLTSLRTERTSAGVYTAEIDNYNRIRTEKFLDYTTNREKTASYEYGASSQRLLRSVRDTEMVNYLYNAQGLVTEAIRSSTIEGSKLEQTFRTEYNDLGFPVKTSDENGDITYYLYAVREYNYRLIQAVKCMEASEFDAGASHDTHSEDYRETYAYDEYGNVCELDNGYEKNRIENFNGGQEASYSSSAGEEWKFRLNEAGTLAAISDGEQKELINYTYDNRQVLTRTTYHPSDVCRQYENYTYDDYGNMTAIECLSEDSSSGAPVSRTDAVYTSVIDYKNYKQTITSNGVSYAYEDRYGGNMLNARVSIYGNDYSGVYTYYGRLDGLLQQATYTIDGLTRTYTPQYNDKKQVIAETDGNHESAYTYDTLGRVENYQLKNPTGEILDISYGYQDTAESAASRIRSVIDNKDSAKSQSYSYDRQGRLTSVLGYSAGHVTTQYSYKYDKYNKLIEEKTPNSITYLYTYDNAYNLTDVNIILPAGVAPPEKYTYNSRNQLIKHSNYRESKYFAYDDLGNPVKYGVSSQTSENNMRWTQGRLLKSGTYRGNAFSYKYDAEGIRYEKTVNGVTTRYYLEGGQVIAEERVAGGVVTDKIYYIYNQSGIAGMYRNGSTYYFRKDGQGNVTEILNYSGTVVAEYTYTAWGACTIHDTTAEKIGTRNPFRYRGYYQDDELSQNCVSTKKHNKTAKIKGK